MYLFLKLFNKSNRVIAMLLYVVIFCKTYAVNAQNIKKVFNKTTFYTMKGDSASLISAKKRIYVCVGTASCGLCFFQLEKFFKGMDSAKFEIALLIQSPHADKNLIKERYYFLKNIKNNYHYPIDNGYNENCSTGFFKSIKSCGSPFIIVATENNVVVNLIKYESIFTDSGLVSERFKKRIINFLTQN